MRASVAVLSLGNLSVTTLQTLRQGALAALLQPDASTKMEVVQALHKKVKRGAGHTVTPVPLPEFEDSLPSVWPLPDEPLLAGEGQHGRPKGVSLNVFILHSLAHIEYNAVQSYLDTIARFAIGTDGTKVPTALFEDCLGVAADEAKHFGWLSTRLQELGSRYGALPAHDGLWRDAIATKDCLASRLVVLPLVAESRALDSEDRLVSKLRSVGDPQSADMVGRICKEEVAHVAMGVRWFRWLCERDGVTDPGARFQELARKHVRAPLPRPLNDEARQRAGLPMDWYLPLAAPERRAARQAAAALS